MFFWKWGETGRLLTAFMNWTLGYLYQGNVFLGKSRGDAVYLRSGLSVKRRIHVQYSIWIHPSSLNDINDVKIYANWTWNRIQRLCEYYRNCQIQNYFKYHKNRHNTLVVCDALQFTTSSTVYVSITKLNVKCMQLLTFWTLYPSL
jgi:hypothetical protein